MNERSCSYRTKTRIEKKATILKKEENITYREALNIVSQAKGFKSFNEANTLYKNWLRQLIENEKEKNKMIKLIARDKVIIHGYTDGEYIKLDKLTVNSSNILYLSYDYKEGKINITSIVHSRVINSTPKEDLIFDAYIRIHFPNNPLYSEIVCHFKDARIEYYRILRKLGIKKDI